MAINHLTGHLRIIACPGSGKTEVVSNRIARLIENGSDPKSIVAFTFTEKAAEELKTRVRMILETRCPDKADFGDMFVGTIHAFCFFMLKEIEPAYRSYDVLDDPKRIAFVSKSMNFYKNLGLVSLMRHNRLRYYDTVSKFLDSADIIMTEDIDPEKLSDEKFAKSYNAYRNLLREEKYFDFSSIVHSFVKAVSEDDEKLRILGNRVKHLIVDEYQDVNRIQEMLVELLSTGAQSVCVVGDDDQNIYHWRGSDVEIIRTFRERYSNYDVSDIHLNINFRSTHAIIHTSRRFIENNTKRLPKDMKSNKGLKRRFENGDLIYNHFHDDTEEFDFIFSKIKELLNTDFYDKRNKQYALSYSDFAVLVRTNDDAATIVRYLDEGGIPCISYSGTSIFERPETVLAMDCIGYVFGCKGYNSENIPELGDLGDRYSSIFNSDAFPLANKSSFVRKLGRIRKQAENLLEKTPKDYFGDLGLQGYYYRILNAMGAEDFDFGEVRNYNLAALSRAISDYESVWVRLRASEVKGFFYFVYAFARKYYIESAHSNPSLVNAVNVLTIHKAKGLEFPVVFVPNFESKMRRPDVRNFVDASLYESTKYTGDIEDERRVFYTAMTRSEKYLFITGSQFQHNKKKSYQPHKFLDNLDRKYFSLPTLLRRSSSGLPPKIRKSGTYPTSFSQLSCYGRCPHEFRLRHIYEFNAGVPVTFGYGTNIHNMLNIIHINHIRKNRIPDEKEIEIILDRLFKLRYATDSIAKKMKKSVLKIVKNYVRLHKHDFNRILETEKKFEFVINDALISGQIDLLKRIDDAGRVTEVEIIDFKTDRNDSIYQGDYERQLKFYAIACLESLGLHPEKAYIHHLDENRKSYVNISTDKLDAVREEVKEQVSKILRKDFPARYSKTICSGCDYRVLCPHKKFRIGVNL